LRHVAARVLASRPNACSQHQDYARSSSRNGCTVLSMSGHIGRLTPIAKPAGVCARRDRAPQGEREEHPIRCRDFVAEDVPMLRTERDRNHEPSLLVRFEPDDQRSSPGSCGNRPPKASAAVQRGQHIGDQRAAAGDRELLEQCGDVHLYGTFGDAELGGDLTVAEAPQYQLQHVGLAPSQSGRIEGAPRWVSLNWRRHLGLPRGSRAPARPIGGACQLSAEPPRRPGLALALGLQFLVQPM